MNFRLERTVKEKIMSIIRRNADVTIANPEVAKQHNHTQH